MTAMFEGYGSSGPAYDEMFDGQALRPPYRRLRHSLREMSTPELVSRVEQLQASYLDQGVPFDASSRWTPGRPSSAVSSSA